ncbi:MAG: carbamoyltransferase HypF [Candidatus Acididesulfobacter diazotrophicus]|jgi:hydrogenase maturation protein HypF|uniref:acylphosphatase n=1 Tax=Candidatus Acididesulfobacter diazotrophicus TaxID=2597226 RepID=A0A519BJZ1_9DELT|nr:MAG: carbamoyltransferase HypF [Candidatus Acididesulfobacter diazotrophicus]
MIRRAIISITGIVQGVGFRPFVYRLSQKYSINGYIINDISGVKIEAEADEEKLNYFINEIKFNKPPLSVIYDINYIYETPLGYSGFVIGESKNSADSDINASVKVKKAAVSPDIATCDDCLSELLNPADRRFLYPFINCTNCGPRFTITKKLPYDRVNTTMDKFKMCNECLEEYANPSDRRFHAQPNACFNCGPEIEFIDKNGKKFSDIFGKITSLIKDGGIAAVKGIGGFHIMCDAANEDAVNRLRISKNRPKKPFAIMFKNVSEILKYAQANEFEIDLLNSKERPIVLLKYKGGLAKNINCGFQTIGAFLPYTPIHHIIFSIINIPLVATSGNISDEPIIADDKEALIKLGKFADGLLVYNREIHRKCDDSVIKVITINNGYNDYYKNKNNNKLNKNPDKFYFLEENRNSYNNINYNLTDNNDNNQHNYNNNHNINYNLNNDDNHYSNYNNYNAQNNIHNTHNNNYLNIIIRRSRGFVPSALGVPFKLKRNIIATGSNLKNTFAYGIKGSDKIILSQHIGDLNNLYSYEYFCSCIEEAIAFYDFKPDIIISDMHPEYESTKFAGEFAEKFNIPHIKLQHHKAHIISCMAENMLPLENDILGVSWDGTGYGEDKTIWGGEFFEGNYLNLNRTGSFKKFKLIGSEKAIKQPQRIFLSLMFEILGDKIINICDGNNSQDNKKNIGSNNITKINNKITGNNNHDNINKNTCCNRHGNDNNSNDMNGNDKNNNSDNDDNIQGVLIQEISGFSMQEISKLYKLWKNDINSPETSSVGRLFDAVSCMCGFKGEVTYEGEAAIFLENLALSLFGAGASLKNIYFEKYGKYNYRINAADIAVGINFVIDWRPIISDIFSRLIELRKNSADLYNCNKANSNAINAISLKFINTLVSIVLDVSLTAGKSNICLSGGVFQNSILTGKLFHELKKRGLFVFINQKVPINDGGISLGQALYGGIIEF